jgi:very-short-patch-repair endonuclease
MKLAQALDRTGVLFIPSSRARFTTSGSGGRDNREVDFLVCSAGRWGVLEVDGPHHSADHDKWRDERFRAHGVEVIARFPSDRCHDDPRGVVEEFLAVLAGNHP